MIKFIKNHQLLFGIIFPLLSLVGIYLVFTAGIWYPGITPNGISKILIEDYKFGMRAIGTGKLYGRFMLKPIQETSENFTLLNQRNAFWVAEVLSSIDNQEAIAMCHMLAERKDGYAPFVGLICLSRQDRGSIKLSENSILVTSIKEYIAHQQNRQEIGSPLWNDWFYRLMEIKARTELALKALNNIGDPSIKPLIQELLTYNISQPLREKAEKTIEKLN